MVFPRHVPEGTSVADLLKDQPEEVRQNAIAAKINGRPVDLSHSIKRIG